MPNSQQRVGRGKFQQALYGKDQFGLKLSEEDRRKMMRSGAMDIIEGNRTERERAQSFIEMADQEGSNIERLMAERAFSGEYDEPMTGDPQTDNEIRGGVGRAMWEVPTMMATSVLADIPAGWAGMMAPEGERVNAIENVQEKLTYMPRGETSQAVMNWLGEKMNAIGETLLPIREGYEGVMNPLVGPSIAAIPWVTVGAAAETVPGPGKAKRAAGAAERASGRFVRAAEEAADSLNIEQLAETAQLAEKYDPNVTRAAQAMEAGQPIPDADPTLAGNQPRGDFTPEMDQPDVETKIQILEDEYRDLEMNRERGREGDYDLERMQQIQDEIYDLERGMSAVPENDAPFDWSAGNARPRGGGPENPADKWTSRNPFTYEAFEDLSQAEQKWAIDNFGEEARVREYPRSTESGRIQLSDEVYGPVAAETLGMTRAGRSQRGAVDPTLLEGGDRVLATQAGRNVATNTAEIVRDQPKPQDLPPVNVKTPGAKVGSLDRRVGTTGKYRGAPRHIDSPQKLGKMRKDLVASLERGAPGRQWYDRSSEAALDLTADRPNLRDRYVGSIAVTSADTAVPSNAGFAIKGFNQLNAGDPVHTGRYPQRMSRDIETIASGEEKMLSDKVGPFYEANKISDLGKDVRPTNDLWMARAFGYTQIDPKTGKTLEWSSGLGEAQHRFMDEEINRLVDIANERKLGGHDDWTPERVQAAIWVDTKARREGTSIERAATDFATDLDARSINITSETTPANALNHMPGVYGDEARGQLAFEQQNRIMTDEKGRNILSTGANALTRPQTTGVGVYEGASNPVAVNRILGSTETGVPTMDPSSRKIAETVASTEGLLKGQESVGYNFLRPPKKVGDANAAIVPQVDDLKGFQQKLDDQFGGSVIATPSEEGIRILKVDGEPFDAKQRKALQGIVGEKPDWKINSGDLVGGFGDYKPSNYLNTIDDTVAGNMDVNTRWAAKALEDLDTTLAKEFPDAGPRNEILQKTRQALAEGGIAKVRELVKQGVLPAVVIGVLAGGQAGSPESQRQQT